MKNNLLAIVLFLFVATPAAFSQNIDLKANPLGIIWGGDIDLSVEYAVSDEFGIEARIPFGGNSLDIVGEDFRRFRTGAIVSGRYYFRPEMGTDNFYAGVYGKFIYTTFRSDIANSVNNFNRGRFALGLLFGYKFVSEQNIVFDINLGLGRAIFNNYKFVNDDLSEDEQSSVTDSFEALSSLFKIDLVSSISVGYRFGLGSRKR